MRRAPQVLRAARAHLRQHHLLHRLVLQDNNLGKFVTNRSGMENRSRAIFLRRKENGDFIRQLPRDIILALARPRE
jgi:hypothetical protein